MAERIGYIYKLTTPDFKIYIGKTKSLSRRFNKYKKSFECGMMYEEIQKHGWDNIDKEFLYSGVYNEELFSDLEKHYIRLYNTFGSENGLNSQSGGKKGFLTSKKALKNMSKSHLGIKDSELTKERKSESQRISWSKNKRVHKKIMTSKSVLFDPMSGVYYNSIADASRCIGIKRTTLNAMLSGQNKNKTNLIYA